MATYLITQATGQQSRSIITQLLLANVKIHALVRNLSKVPSSLHHPSITLFQGESKNFDEVLLAAQGCTGVFLNTIPYPGLEALQAKTVVSASRQAGVHNIVYASTFTTGVRSMWDNDEVKAINLHGYFSSKAECEDIVRNGGFDAYTIVRPAIIHHDFFLPGSEGNFPRLSSHNILDHLSQAGRKLPFTDCHDVGKYASAALLDPSKFRGQEIDVASDNVTMEEIRDMLVRVSGKAVQIERHTLQETKDMGIHVFGALFHLWGNSEDFTAHLTQAKEAQTKFGISFTPIEDALQRDRARLMDCLDAAEE